MRIQTTLAAALVLCFPLLASAGPVYSVNRAIGGGSVTGTIETDGTIGVLGTGNVLGWNLSIADGAGGDALTLDSTANSQLLVIGSLFSATASGLFFDFAGSAGFALFQNPSIGSGQNWWCLEGTASGCSGAGNSIESVTREGGTVFSARQGTLQVAELSDNSVPEPGSIALVLAAAGIALGTRRKQR